MEQGIPGRTISRRLLIVPLAPLRLVCLLEQHQAMSRHAHSGSATLRVIAFSACNAAIEQHQLGSLEDKTATPFSKA